MTRVADVRLSAWYLAPEVQRRLFTLFVVGFSFLYGWTLSMLPSESFKDWSNYLAYPENSFAILAKLWDKGLLALLANEPVWLLFNASLNSFLTPDLVARVFVFVPAMIVAWTVLKRNPASFLVALLILLAPIVVKNHLTHVRQGVAIAIFLLGYFSERKFTQWSLILMSPFVHASFFFIILVFFLSEILRREKIFVDVRILFFTALGVTVGVSLGWLASVLGARQSGDYEFVAAQVSGLGFVFWGFVAVLMLGEGRRFFRTHAFELSIIVFYMSTYFLVEVAGRIFESAIILVLIAGARMTGLRRLCFIGALLMFVVQQWLVRSSGALLGFGVS